MTRLVILIGAALLVVEIATASARTLSNTRTNVCRSGFCADVTTETRDSPQAVFTSVRLRAWPRSTHRNLRCADGRQVQGGSIRCSGRAVSVQACTKPTIGRSRCSSWVAFR